MSADAPFNFDPCALWRDWFVRSEQQWSEGLSTCTFRLGDRAQGWAVGLVAGRSAITRMWPQLENWLAERSV
jgi:hypothetical protein